MPSEAAKSLEAYLKREVGSDLRSIAHYNEDTFTFVFLRASVAEEYSRDELKAVFDDLRREAQGRREQERLYHLGDLYCTQRVFANGIVLHFVQGADVGTLVTLDPGAAPELSEFITGCLTQLYRHSPQAITSLPTWLEEADA